MTNEDLKKEIDSIKGKLDELRTDSITNEAILKTVLSALATILYNTRDNTNSHDTDTNFTARGETTDIYDSLQKEIQKEIDAMKKERGL